MSNGKNKVKEHPKPQIELIAGTREAIEGYAMEAKLSFDQAAQVLIFNELRCIHFHYDLILAKEQEREKAGEKD